MKKIHASIGKGKNQLALCNLNLKSVSFYEFFNAPAERRCEASASRIQAKGYSLKKLEANYTLMPKPISDGNPISNGNPNDGFFFRIVN